MRLLSKLSINSIGKHFREVFLVMISIALTISMMTMVAFMMSSLYKTFAKQVTRG